MNILAVHKETIQFNKPLLGKLITSPATPKNDSTFNQSKPSQSNTIWRYLKGIKYKFVEVILKLLHFAEIKLRGLISLLSYNFIKNEIMQPIKDQAQRTAEQEIKRIFKCEVELRDACLNQLNKSISSKINNNLTPKYIGYIDNGHSDKNILMLNITCYDKDFNQNFSLQLEKFKETHKLVCLRKHRVESLHDPRTDVKFTKFVFDYIIRKLNRALQISTMTEISLKIKLLNIAKKFILYLINQICKLTIFVYKDKRVSVLSDTISWKMFSANLAI
ncbi:Uncharacterized protein FWK35_00009357 [Aphis craccivora]|uniref:Uncharacterized protein n=1 Tax=Aphis craccivora TaxID=307492 RepID=A0A6G0ZBA5_APHCR|nr:Uncharacterized protein FWK35_00009357 [Aphis craccivora]